MAQSITLGNDTYLDASGITAISKRVPLTQVIQPNRGSETSYTIDAPRDNDGNYSMGIMLIATGSGAASLYMIYLRSSTFNNAVEVTKIGGSNAITFTGMYSGSTWTGKITLTASATVYGGIRVIWLT